MKKGHKFLKLLFIVVLLLLILLVLKQNKFFSKKNSNNSQKDASTESELYNDVLVSNKLWAVVNKWRSTQSLDEYIRDKRLCSYAQVRLLELDGDLSHQGFFEFEEQVFAETDFAGLGENLASGVSQQNLDEVLENWLNSPEHKRNLGDSFSHACIVCQQSICVQLFARF
jgi:uncharacterized protein YkwD